MDSLYNSIDQVADAYVGANRLKSESVRRGVKDNFLRKWDAEYSDIKVDQVLDVEFDKVIVIKDDDILEIEI